MRFLKTRACWNYQARQGFMWAVRDKGSHHNEGGQVTHKGVIFWVHPVDHTNPRGSPIRWRTMMPANSKLTTFLLSHCRRQGTRHIKVSAHSPLNHLLATKGLAQESAPAGSHSKRTLFWKNIEARLRSPPGKSPFLPSRNTMRLELKSRAEVEDYRWRTTKASSKSDYSSTPTHF